MQHVVPHVEPHVDDAHMQSIPKGSLMWFRFMLTDIVHIVEFIVFNFEFSSKIDQGKCDAFSKPDTSGATSKMKRQLQKYANFIRDFNLSPTVTNTRFFCNCMKFKLNF